MGIQQEREKNIVQAGKKKMLANKKKSAGW